MTIPIRNVTFDKIYDSGSMTDGELYKALAKDGRMIAMDRFNKILLDLEIMGIIKVSWLSKDTRRVEVAEQSGGADDADSEAEDLDYEASFPGAR